MTRAPKLEALLRDALLREDSPAAERFIGMGFTLNTLEIVWSDTWYGYVVRAVFICVCGRAEMLWTTLGHDAIEKRYSMPTVYDMIQSAGSMGRQHLLDDGYTEEQIADMERRLEEYRMRKAA